MSIRIGLIDSGININHLIMTKKDNVINGWKGNYPDFNDFLGHGTQCADLILKTAENVSQIYNVKVFDKSLKTTTKNILEALQWCIDNHIQLINLSLSINDLNFYYEFKQICDEAYRKNIIIVASADNFGRPCLPAYLDNVIGVGVAKENNGYLFYTDSNIQFYLNIENGEQTTSFAAARMTGIIANILTENPNIDIEQLKKMLQTQALPLKAEREHQKNEKIDFSEYTTPIKLNGNLESINKLLNNINDKHIVKNQIQTMALINITNIDTFSVELKIREELCNRRYKFAQISSNPQSESCAFDYSFLHYTQLPEKLHSAYAKAIIEHINYENSEAELIIIGINNPIIPSGVNNSGFFDCYSIPELSLLFGFQPDACLLIVNELMDFKYIQRNIGCLRSLFNADVLFLIYSSPYASVSENVAKQYVANYEQIKRISETHFLKLRTELIDKEQLNIYNVNDDTQLKCICDEIQKYLGEGT